MDLLHSLSRKIARFFPFRSRSECEWYVNLLYHHFLGREPEHSGLNTHTSALLRGAHLSEVAEIIKSSDEAHHRTRKLNDDYEQYVRLLYGHYLGREPESSGLRGHTNALLEGMSLSEAAQIIKSSVEANKRQQDLKKEHESCVKMLYSFYLGREPEDWALQEHSDALCRGAPLSRLAHTLENSVEAQQRRRSFQSDKLSDGEFVVTMAELLFHNRGALPREVEQWRAYLQEDRTKRIELLRGAVDALLSEKNRNGKVVWDSSRCQIMGTDRFLTESEWLRRARECGSSAKDDRKIESLKQPFHHSDSYTVSAIASLYKGRKFLARFLDNIVTQTMFDRSELIIIDADSPEGEAELISEYQKIYPNIIYKRMNYRIGIYDAWNVGVELARGKFLTNTNLDDLRRADSFELQASALEQHPFVDIVYQDFFYSFDASFSFDQVARLGFKSDVPIVTPHNLLTSNSPHNAPMWRRHLHEELGLFDTTFKSAGDWEFWLRCIAGGKTFFKLNTPHVVYFQNPEGVSTHSETRGMEEGLRVLKRYSEKLISRELRMSREEFAALLGTQPDWNPSTAYYAVTQRELNRLGHRFRDDEQRVSNETTR
jgi:glycosyltransferase involved in cell wall biosynthesis